MYSAQTHHHNQNRSNKVYGQSLTLDNLLGQYKFQGENNKLIIRDSQVEMILYGSFNLVQFYNCVVNLKVMGNKNLIHITQTQVTSKINGNNNTIQICRHDHQSESLSNVVQTGNGNCVKRVNCFTYFHDKIGNNLTNSIQNITSLNKNNPFVKYQEQNTSKMELQAPLNLEDQDFNQQFTFNASYARFNNQKKQKKNFQHQKSIKNGQTMNQIYKRGNWSPNQLEQKVQNKTLNNFSSQIQKTDADFNLKLNQKQKQKQNDSHHSNNSNEIQEKKQQLNLKNDRQKSKSNYVSSTVQNKFDSHKPQQFIKKCDDKIFKRGNWDPKTQRQIKMIDQNQELDFKHNSIFNFNTKNQKKESTQCNNYSIYNGSLTQRVMPSSHFQKNIFSKNWETNEEQSDYIVNKNSFYQDYFSKQIQQYRQQNRKRNDYQYNKELQINKTQKQKQAQVKMEKSSFDSTKAYKNGENNIKKKTRQNKMMNPTKNYNSSHLFSNFTSNLNMNPFTHDNRSAIIHQTSSANKSNVQNIFQHNKNSIVQQQKSPNIPPMNIFISNSNSNHNNNRNLPLQQTKNVNPFHSSFTRPQNALEKNNSKNNYSRGSNNNIFTQNNQFYQANNNIRQSSNFDASNNLQQGTRYQFRNDEQYLQQAQNQRNNNLLERFGPRALQLRYDQDIISVSDSDSQNMPVDSPTRNQGSLYIFNNTMNIINHGSRYSFENGGNIFGARLDQARMSQNNIFNGGGGLTPNQIKKLPKSVNSHEQQLLCMICMQEIIKNREQVTFLFCFHYYHSKCIEKWLMQKAKCPSCQHNVREGIKKDKFAVQETETPKQEK